MDKKHAVILIFMALSFAGSVSAVVPPYSLVLGWAPHYSRFSSGGQTTSTIISKLNTLASYSMDSIEFRNNACTAILINEYLQNRGVGIVVLDSHGCPGGVRLETFDSTQVPDPQAAAYSRCAVYDQTFPSYSGHFLPLHWSDPSISPDFWGIVVDAPVTRGWINDGGKEPPGLFYDVACNDMTGTPSTGAPSFFGSTCTFAYAVTANNYTYDLNQIFGRMLGTIDSGAHREAFGALAATPNPQISVAGSSIELCPVVTGTYPYYHPTKYARRAYAGHIEFSSPMADDTLSQIVCGPGVSWQVGGEPSWVDGTQTRINFAYCINGGAGKYTITVKGSAKAKTLDPTHPLYLDGNKMAPNQDDHVICFKVAECDP